MTTTSRNAKDVTVSRNARVMDQMAAAAQSGVGYQRAARESRSAEDIKAEIEERLQAALDRATRPEIAELKDWWDIYAVGPIQPIFGPPVQPHCVVKAGEPAFVVSVLVLNPFQDLPGPTNAATLLSNFGLPFEIQFQTSNITTMTPAGSDVQNNNLSPGQFFYVNVTSLPTSAPGMYETNILARIEGVAVPTSAPQFGGFATSILNIDDPDLFGTGMNLSFNQPVRYMVYP